MAALAAERSHDDVDDVRLLGVVAPYAGQNLLADEHLVAVPQEQLE